MDYFKQAKWKVDWINTACDLICTTYDLSYAPHHIQDNAESIPDPNACKEEVSPFPSISMTVTSWQAFVLPSGTLHQHFWQFPLSYQVQTTSQMWWTQCLSCDWHGRHHSRRWPEMVAQMTCNVSTPFTHGAGLSDHPQYVYNLFIHLSH